MFLDNEKIYMKDHGTEILMAQVLTASSSSPDLLNPNTHSILPSTDSLKTKSSIDFESMNLASKVLDLDSGKENDSNATTEEVFNEGNESLDSSKTEELDYTSELLYTIQRANMKQIAVSSSNALLNFHDILIPQLQEKKEIIILLDYDGTLTPIVSDPSKALLPEKTRDILGKLSQLTTVGIVSGRSLEKVQDFVGVETVFYAGSHGFDISIDCQKDSHNDGTKSSDISDESKKEQHLNNNRSDTRTDSKEQVPKKSTETTVRYQVAQDALPFLQDIKEELESVLVYGENAIKGAGIEDNKYSVSAHYRNVKPEEQVGELYRIVSTAVARYPMLKLSTGKKVLEIKPDIMWNKGKAMKWVLEALGMLHRDDVCTIYIGDDVTDEDAFEVFAEEKEDIFGLGIVVTDENKITGAEYSLRNPTEVADFLLLISEYIESHR